MEESFSEWYESVRSSTILIDSADENEDSISFGHISGHHVVRTYDSLGDAADSSNREDSGLYSRNESTDHENDRRRSTTDSRDVLDLDLSIDYNNKSSGLNESVSQKKRSNNKMILDKADINLSTIQLEERSDEDDSIDYTDSSETYSTDPSYLEDLTDDELDSESDPESLPDTDDKSVTSEDSVEADAEDTAVVSELRCNVKLPPEERSGYNLRSKKITKSPGKRALATQQREKALTEDRLKDLHVSLNDCPGEDEQAQDPKGLKVSLMPHQRYALAWLLWREEQRPQGGILADDMGLGKTLTMISLIVSTLKHSDRSNSDQNSGGKWAVHHRSIRTKGGTLVVCPASVLNQWDAEIKKHVKYGVLTVKLFYGNKRESKVERLADNDVVITTYNLMRMEHKKYHTSILYEIYWKRVILDEAHVVRNHKTLGLEVVCDLSAGSRWAMTGTPIQNKILDLYSILKFLKCSPFDDLRVWKRLVDNDNVNCYERLTTVMKTLMLRRTKKELVAKSKLGTLPNKNIKEIHVKLDAEEKLVYEKVLVFSRTLFAQFLHQGAQKTQTSKLNVGRFNAQTFLKTPKSAHFTRAQLQLLARHSAIGSYELLVLLLRLRQICCHPSLVHDMLDDGELNETNVVDLDVTAGIGALRLDDNENIDPNDMGVDGRVAQNLLTSKNPVFNPGRQSSKMRAVLSTIRRILVKGDKVVVVSQWINVLEILRTFLDSLPGANYAIISGKVPVKKRQNIVNDFNSVRKAPKILLLSLTAGGVGLNLVGGNHLLLLDIHWNPQLEAQAEDRIYRVGQKKDVYIYKFICLDTIEQKIKALQDSKIALAQAVLTGAGAVGAAKLTLDDLKSLFGL